MSDEDNATRLIWQQAARLFDQLATQPPEQRALILEGEKISPQARAWLDQLLAAHDQDDAALIDQNIDALVDGLSEHAQHRAPLDEDFKGQRFGPWIVDDEIGRGGMGVVLHGQRADGQFEMAVAIKLLNSAQVGEARKQHLRDELQILARLSHPNIAQVIDGGLTESGLPYLVMEYVDGESIQRYCDTQMLDGEARLALFCSVAEAVAYCHRQLVVHGDIKPDNVLVDRQGQVKLLDFGIASGLGDTSDNKTPANDLRWCSPAYAAPERLSGAAPAVAEDVFSLGALLFELLSGRRIRTARQMTRSVVESDIDTEVMQASEQARRALGNPGRVRMLRGDLDLIISKALAERPDDRYASVEALLDDLSRWQRHEPISIRAKDRGYVTARWLRRHLGLALSSGLIAMAMLVGTGLALWQADEARSSEQNARLAQANAEQARQRADSINDFLLSLFQSRIPELPPNELPTTRQVIDQGISRARDPAAGDPALRAELLLSLASILVSRLQLDEADGLLEEAAQMTASIAEPVPEIDMQRLGLAAQSALMRSQLDESEQLFVEAIALYEQHAPDALHLIELRRSLARVKMSKEEWPEADAMLLRLQDQVSARDDAADMRLSIAGDLAATAAEMSQYDLAGERFAEILALKEAQGHSPQSLAITEVNLGILRKTQLDFAAAERHFNRVIERFSDYTEVPRPARATAYKHLSDLARNRAQFIEAERWLTLAAEEWANIMNLTNPDEDFYIFYHRAQIHEDTERFARAAEDMATALEFILAGSAAPPHRIAEGWARLAGYYCQSGQHEQVDLALNNARAIELDAISSHIGLAQARCALARDETDLELDWVPESVIQRAIEDSGDVSWIATLEVLKAELLLGLNRPTDATPWLNRAEQRLRSINPDGGHPLLNKIADL